MDRNPSISLLVLVQHVFSALFHAGLLALSAVKRTWMIVWHNLSRLYGEEMRTFLIRAAGAVPLCEHLVGQQAESKVSSLSNISDDDGVSMKMHS